MNKLTQGEEQVMQAVWSVGKGSAGDIRAVLAKAGSTAKPTTITTVLRILVDKGFVAFDTVGRSHIYRPAIEKADYSEGRLKSFIARFFGGSPAKLVSFLAERENLSLEDLEQLLDQKSEK